jgi:hypothetical protein
MMNEFVFRTPMKRNNHLWVTVISMAYPQQSLQKPNNVVVDITGNFSKTKLREERAIEEAKKIKIFSCSYTP